MSTTNLTLQPISGTPNPILNTTDDFISLVQCHMQTQHITVDTNATLTHPHQLSRSITISLYTHPNKSTLHNPHQSPPALPQIRHMELEHITMQYILPV